MYKIKYHSNFRNIPPYTQDKIKSKMIQISQIDEPYGKGLDSYHDKIFKRCFEFRKNELRVVYCYDRDTIHVLSVGERSKQKVFNEARRKVIKLRNKNEIKQLTFEKIFDIIYIENLI